MTGTVSRRRSFLFRNARPMADGRLLIQSGQSFLIMEPDEAARIDRWLMISVTADIACIIGLVISFVMSGQGQITEDVFYTVVWVTAGIFILSALAIAVPMLMTMLKRTQPADDYDRLKETWDGLG